MQSARKALPDKQLVWRLLDQKQEAMQGHLIAQPSPLLVRPFVPGSWANGGCIQRGHTSTINL